ncbi:MULTISPECIES: LCP family protein [unclassified Streptomyces]|uniref:LCP family protein n=1 Tax=unclassified Streptomyces TaxID=2593676 RepID=UPI002E15C4FE|nr:LCP family protein [Streptomyces sp. NBC_01197]WSS49582.1 LCP family protein [Streptomyces sp. NBC_01180]
MDAHSRGRDDIDPADQWVLNPETGNYELRLNPSGPQSGGRTASSSESASGRTRRRDSLPEQSSRRRSQQQSPPQSPRRDVPGQRSRRAGSGQDGRPGSGPQTAAGRRKRKQQKSRRKKALMWTGGVTAFVLIGGSVATYLLYEHFNNNINKIDVVGGTSGSTKDRAVNILLIGTDKRTGKGNEGYGDKGSVGHADTNILFHVSKDRTNATALSIPRDLITDIPDCQTKQPDGSMKTIPGTQQVRFNTSLGQDDRDPGCTMKTVKAITGLTVDHFMMADFNAIKTLSTAVGGVDVCVAHPVDDKESHLKLPAGKSKVEGEQALAFVRTRHSFGNQGDLDRIKVQQQFLASLIRKMTSGDTLTSPTKLYDLANAATKALTVDSGIGSIDHLKSLAMDLKSVNPKNVTFTTLPVLDNPAEKVHATVVVNHAQADPLFSMMRDDVSLTEVKKKKDAAASKQEALLKGKQANASDVRVKVLNGGAQPGSAQTTLTWLQNTEGVLKSENGGNYKPDLTKTTLSYAPNQADQARKLADIMGLPAAALKPGTKDSVGLTPMTLVLGADFKAAGTPITAPAKPPADIQKVEADKSVCAK